GRRRRAPGRRRPRSNVAADWRCRSPGSPSAARARSARRSGPPSTRCRRGSGRRSASRPWLQILAGEGELTPGPSAAAGRARLADPGRWARCGLPSVVPMLWRYRQAVGRTGQTRVGRLTALVGVGYFFVWIVFGLAAYRLGVALATAQMQQLALARAAPIAVGVVVLMAGSLQLTGWKARHLACCREAPGARPYSPGRRRHGLAIRPAPRP